MKKTFCKLLVLVGATIGFSACATSKALLSQSAHANTEHFILHTSFWHELSKHMQYKDAFQQPMVKHQIQAIRHYPKYITHLTENAKPYIYYVYQEVKKRQMPAEIALLPMVESGYNPFLYSHQGATGLWQLMPGTATGLGLDINWWYDERRDITASTDAALNYLEYLHHFFHNWQLAIAAYNAGEGTVLDAIRFNEKQHKPTDFWHLALPAETKTYLPKLLAIASVINNPKLTQSVLTPVPNHAVFATVSIKKQYNLSVLANLANTTETEIRMYNPGYRRFSTGPGTHDHFVIPSSSLTTFSDNVKTYKGEHVTWRHHTVVAGDNLSTLAKTYHTNVGIIKEVNHLDNDELKLKQILLIPVSLYQQSLAKHTTTNQQIAEDNIPGPTRVEYTVKHADTLDGIAKKFNVTSREIKYWNQIQSPYIAVGRTIIIWQNHYVPNHVYFTHIVKSGETLSSISKKFDVSIDEILRYNSLKGTKIQLAQALHIPYPQVKHYHPKFRNQLVIHRVKPGDSISSLAHYYGISKETLMRHNHLHSGQLLRLGQPIKIYFSAR